MYYSYLFRGNTQDAIVAKEKFKEGVKNMRTILINRNDSISSTMINKSEITSYVYRIV
jgi:TRAP-type mannitol/chloroaromatic compound transport system substrate-binding protein